MDYVELDFDEIITTTDEATLFDFGTHELWVPNSLIESDVYNHMVSIEEWFALEKGLI